MPGAVSRLSLQNAALLTRSAAHKTAGRRWFGCDTRWSKINRFATSRSNRRETCGTRSMNRSLPGYLEELYPRPAIEDSLLKLAATVDSWVEHEREDTASPLLAICVLRGGVFFFSDLLQRMTASTEPAFCRAWSYTKGVNGATEQELRLDWQGTRLSGRDVVVVDNICDSGRTLDVACAQARLAGARSVRSVTLVHRQRDDAVHSPTLAGFVYPGKEWLVGYGLRDGEVRSNLPSVFRIVRQE